MLRMVKVLGIILRVSKRTLSPSTPTFLTRKLDGDAAWNGSCALPYIAKAFSSPKSSIRLKSFNSKGFSRIVKMQHFSGNTKQTALQSTRRDLSSWPMYNPAGILGKQKSSPLQEMVESFRCNQISKALSQPLSRWIRPNPIYLMTTPPLNNLCACGKCW